MCDLLELCGEVFCDDAGAGLFELILDGLSAVIDCASSKDRKDPPGGVP
jgi:hypothetical protein